MDFQRLDPFDGAFRAGLRERREVSARVTLLVIALGFVVVCGACGGGQSSNGEEKKTATLIFDDAKAAVRQASSFHMAGQVVDQGLTLDENLSPARGGGQVTVKGATMQIVVGGGEAYIKAD